MAVDETPLELATSEPVPSVTPPLPWNVTVPAGCTTVLPALLVTLAVSVVVAVTAMDVGDALSVTATADAPLELLEMLVPQPASARQSGKHNQIKGKRRKRGQSAEVMDISVFNSCHQWNGDSFLRRF
jgi:hypothetical protein